MQVSFLPSLFWGGRGGAGEVAKTWLTWECKSNSGKVKSMGNVKINGSAVVEDKVKIFGKLKVNGTFVVNGAVEVWGALTINGYL